jgi:hypothetical protein
MKLPNLVQGLHETAQWDMISNGELLNVAEAAMKKMVDERR